MPADYGARSVTRIGTSAPVVAMRRIRHWGSVLAIVLPVLLAVAGWVLVRQAQGQDGEESRPETASVREPEWRAAARDADAARTALRALRELQAAAAAGLTYAEYLERIVAARAEVDPYTESAGGFRDVKAEMRAALALYVLAGTAWDAKIRKDYADGRLARDPRLSLCPSVLYAVEQSRALPYVPRSRAREIAVAANVPTLWECASARTTALAAHMSFL